VCSERVWTGEPRQAGPGRRAGACLSARGEVAQAETLCDTTVWSEPSKSLGIYLIPALGRADGRSSPTIGPPHSAPASRTTVGLRHRGGLEVN